MTETYTAPPGRGSYSLYKRGAEPELIGQYPRTAEHAISATERARLLSISTLIPHEVMRPDGSLLARYVNGKRADL
ncbi:MAG TPA: hypothetical protein VNV62_06780 [Trebonia sp.]|nr:hypothetical protein [Trebonia sp.]